ncbi:YadA-like family protein [Streptobacillus moniliformis]|uniref:YadA-like family protein n=1 Tax=Streptobacillus moniliformis TaxID=34105 RepID=UPI0007E3528C|nr:YadA-like family protein [Streptobacillus moniliformis]
MEDLEEAKQKDLAKEILTTDEKNKLENENYNNKGAKGKNSIAIGHGASTDKNDGENAIAIGKGAKATTKDSIVLGSDSKNTADMNNVGYDITKNNSNSNSNLNSDATWKPTHGEFAIGDGTNKTRRITGVAAGEKDTDAVNVAQLKKIFELDVFKSKELITFIGNDKTNEIPIKVGDKLNIVGEGSVDNGTAANNIKVTADKDNKKLTIGLAKNLTNIESITVSKNGQETKIEQGKITGVNTIGKNDNNRLVFNNGNSGTAMLKVDGKELTFTKSEEHIKISNVANGISDNDAVNVSQLKKYVDALGGNAKIDDKGNVTGPTYKLKVGATTNGTNDATKDYNTVGDALKALDDAIGNSSKNITDLTNKQISFQGNGGDTDKVSKKLGETLKIQGEGNVSGNTAKDNIKVEKNKDSDGLDIKLAEDLKNLNSIETKEVGGKKTKITTDGVEVTSDKGKANLTADKLTFGPKDDKSTDKTSTEVGKDGITLKSKDGKDSVSIKPSNDTDGGIIEVKSKDGNSSIKIDGEKGSITVLKDIKPDETDGSIAVNKNYVDNQIKAIANGPFEYEAINGKEKVVRGQDGKLYKETDLNNYYYDKDSSSYKPKNNGTNSVAQGPTPLENKDVTVNVMPKNGTPISIGNVASILGEDSITTDDKATEKVKELIDNTNKLYENNKNKVATGTDILALAKAGISFEGNTGSGDKIHRNLGEQVTIKDEGTDGKNNFTSASGNIQVKSDKAKGELTVKLSDKLTNMTSFETKELDDNGNKSKVKLDKEGLTTINKTDDNKYIMSKTGPKGTEIGKYDNDPLMNNNTSPTNSAKYGLDGISLKDDKGEVKLTPTELDFKDNKGRIKGLSDPVDQNDAVNKKYVDEKIASTSGGIANAIAMANLPQISGKGHNIAGSYGYYNGEHAFALGLSGTNEVSNLVYRASGSLNTRGHVSLGAGLGYQFDNIGKRSKEMLKLDRYGNINLLDEKVYKHGIKIENLEISNEKLKKDNHELKMKVAELEKLIHELMKK